VRPKSRALFDAELASHIRPTGTVGAIGGAAAGARLLGLTEDQTVAALGLAANTACGLNEWPWAGGLEMVFHPGVAARNAVTAVLLAREGFFASPTAIDGRAGLFAAYGRRERAADVTPLADGNYEIMSVYWKPAPACNYVQTPCQAALGLVERGVRAADVESVHVGSFTSAIQYPGCDHAGPFPGVLEAKMSIQYSVAAVLVHGAIEEANYRELDNSEVARLARATTLSVNPAFEAAYPQKQGAEVSVVLKDGRTLSERRDDVRAFDRNDVRRRFEAAAAARLGEGNAKRALEIIDDLGAGKSSPAALLRLTARQ
jgi:2-methylcitrate dehydratase PrpD